MTLTNIGYLNVVSSEIQIAKFNGSVFKPFYKHKLFLLIVFLDFFYIFYPTFYLHLEVAAGRTKQFGKITTWAVERERRRTLYCFNWLLTQC